MVKLVVMCQLEGLQAEAAESHLTTVLSVGLAPGLTNLLALLAKQLMDQTNAIDIFIMLGMLKLTSIVVMFEFSN